MSILKCACCGADKFVQNKVLWKELIEEWAINKAEVKYVEEQQGYACVNCGSNLRSITLAQSIMNSYAFKGTLIDFVKKYKKLKVLEINEAGSLTKFFANSKSHNIVRYPEIDIMKMDIPDSSYDLVIHSDTLEHIPNTDKALRECLRVLKREGYLCYTVPIIVDRLTKKRSKIKNKSYHGYPGGEKPDYLVYTEYGADAWKEPMLAGFSSVTLTTLRYPASLAISCKKL